MPRDIGLPETRNLVLREATGQDLEALSDLWVRTGLARSYNPPRWDVPFCLRNPNARLFVAETADGLAGSIMVGHDGHRGWLYYLAVTPGQRGQGLGRRLVEHAESWLASAGIWKAQLMVRTDNGTAHGFYGALGYAPSEVTVLSKAIGEAKPLVPPKPVR